MSLKVEKATREFRYNNIPLADPGIAMSAEEVRTFYANVYPEIVNAEIDGPEAKGAKQVYTFRRAVGTKGGDVVPLHREEPAPAAGSPGWPMLCARFNTTPAELHDRVRPLFLWMYEQGINELTITRTGSKAMVSVK